MKISSKRTMSRILSFVMIVSAVFTNMTMVNASTGSGPIDVWDFGGVEESDASLYTNYITRDFLDNWTEVGDEASGNKGKFLNGGTFDMDGGLTLVTNANDRAFNEGPRGYALNADAIFAFPDGYTANGMWYANGTGGDNRRYLQFANVAAGSEVKVYSGSSNASDNMVNFTYLDSEGTQSEEQISAGGESSIMKFIAKYTGDYKIWFNAAGGKPIVNRVVITPPVGVTMNIDLAGLPVEGYSVEFKNDTTGESTPAVVEGTTATAVLTPGYTYTATLTGALGYGFTSDTKTVTVTTDDLLAGSKTVTGVVETKETYTATGNLLGFDPDYDTSKLVLSFVPDEESNAETVTATVNADLSYSATLEPDVEYTATLEGVNDYEVVENGVIVGNGNMTQDITVAMKATYTVTGNIVGSANVTEIAFVNVDDNYSYGGTVDGSTYAVVLRDGSYEVQAVAEGYSTSGHVVVSGSDTQKDILFVPVNPEPPVVDTSVRDIYVGCEGQVNNYDTMGEALEAAKVMNPTSEAERVTIHIAPGTYREQISVETPYLTFVPEGNGEVVLTWYYGIGYNYYSIDGTGYYNEENAFDKYDKGTPSKWGVGTYVKSGASNFKAENITFEASFNKYITDEEIADGVEETGALPARNYALDVTSRAATERSTALCVEASNAEFKDCTFVGSQDTLYMGDGTNTYYKNCTIEGNTDYIFGSGNAVFDGCELRFCGYSDTAMGGYITAGRSNNAAGYMGYLFRSCTITGKDGMQIAAGYYGRPWDAGADITFLNTTMADSATMTAEGWTSMSGVAPEAANFKEYGTVNADGTPVDTSARVAGTVLTDAEAQAIDAKAYFNGWTPTYYTEDSGAVEFVTAPYWSTDGDVLLPATGDTFTAKYSLGDNDVNDASKIVYEVVDTNDVNATGTVVKATTAAADTGVLITNDMIGKYLKATITPATIMGNTGAAVSIITARDITLGSGSVDTERPSGKAVVFLAGDSTVKDYSAGAINNSGATRPEGSWGEFLGYFLNDNYEVMDYAQGGRSSRTFIDGTKDDGSDKYLNLIKEQMMAGDYLFIQFGHNDSSADYADRYVPVGEPDANGSYPYTAPSSEGAGDGSFKWYLQEMVDAAKEVGATPVMVTPVSRKYFNSDGTIRPHHGDADEYVTATIQVAEENDILCFDLFNYTKSLYEQAYAEDGAGGASALADRLFAAGDSTHHSKLGGFIIGAELAEMIQNSSLGLANAVVTPSSMYITEDKGNVEFTVNNSGVLTAYDRNSDNVFDESVPCVFWEDYANGLLAEINDADVPDTTETTTEGTTETTTEATTVTESTTEEPIVPPADKGTISITPEIVSQSDTQVVVAYKLEAKNAGFNNYTLFFTFDENVLTPVSVSDGDITMTVKDALGNDISVPASNADNFNAQLTNAPLAGNTDFPEADGIKTQAELGIVKLSYCIFDNSDFADATAGALPKFEGNGTLFTVTYDVKGDVSGTTLGVDVNVINAVSADTNIASKPENVIEGSYTFEGETTESTTEGTTETSTESTTETSTEEPTESTTEAPTESTTEAPTEEPTESTTETPTEEPTESTTETPTEAPTVAPTEATTEAPVEETTRRPVHSGGGGGAGASSLVINNYTTTEATTEGTSEDVTDEDTEGTTEALPEVVVVIGSNDILVDGESYEMDVAPYIQASSNSTMVPLRFVAIAITGGNVEEADTSDMVSWDPVAKQATINKNGVTIVFTSGSNTAVINGVETAIPYGVTAEIRDDRMFVPFRIIGETLGAEVEWDADTKTAYYNREA